MAVQNVVEIIGGKQLSELLGGMAQRTENMAEVFRAEIRFMEQFEAGVFSSLGGREVQSGRLRSSLTESGNADAVRKPSAKGLEFGTHVFYARFQTSEVGPQTERGGMARTGENLVLKMPPATADRVTHALAAHVTGGK
jgi:hypothetical protein